MADLERRSPLTEDATANAGTMYGIRELPGIAKVRAQALRSRGLASPAADPRQLPGVPNTACGTDPIALWTAPDEWLVYSPTLTPEALTNGLASIPADAPLVITDISSASVVLELSGPRAIDLLMRDCPLDLEGDAIPPGHCAQTLFAQTRVMIHRLAEGDSWRLFIERSVALHVREWLLDTANMIPEASP